MKSISFSIGFFFLIILSPLLLAGEGWNYFSKSFMPGYQIEQKKITAAAESHDGLLVIGTKGALYVFDGRQYLRLAFPDTLTTTEVLSVAAWKKGLLVGLSDGKLLYYNNIHIDCLPTLLLSATAKITSVDAGENDHYAVSTYGNGIHLSTQNGIWHLLDGLSLYCVVSDTNGNFWAGSDAGLIHIYHEDNHWKTKTYDTNTGLPDLIVTALHMDKNGLLWVGMHDGGFCTFKTDTQEWICPNPQSWKYGIVKRIHSKNHSVWIGSNENGVFLWDNQTQSLETFLAKSSTRLVDMIASKLNGFWMIGPDQISWTPGTDIGTLNHSPIIDNKDIIALHAINEEQLWISNSSGLFRLDVKKNQMQAIKLETKLENEVPVISCFFTMDENNIWAGSFGQGLFLLNHDGDIIRHFTEADGLPNNSILSIKGNDHQIVIASLGGAGYAQKTSLGDWNFSTLDSDAGPGTNYVYDALIDQKGRFWFATDGKGAGYFENHHFHMLTHELLAEKTIYSLCEDAFGAIWLSVPDDGLYRLYNDSLMLFALQQGLSSNVITALASMDDTFLIAGGINGLDLINTKDFEIVQIGTIYGLETGQTALHGISKIAKGTVFIATENAVFQFQNIDQIAQRKPLTVPKQLLVNFLGVAYEQSSVFDFTQRQLGLSVSPVWYPNPDLVQLLGQLSGKNSQSFTTRDQKINLGQLSPGNYQLMVLAAVGSSTFGQPVQFVFEVKKPFWENWWFLLAVAILLLLAIRFWLKERERKIRKEQEMIREKLNFEYRNLRNQVNPHFLFNSFSTLIALIETQGKEAGKYVEKLSDYFRQILQYRDTEFINLEEELQLLETYIFLQKQRFGDGLQTNISIPESVMQSKIPPMTLQMLTENALKHNVAIPSKPLKIEITAEGSFIEVKNNIQPKQNKEVSTGLGLDNISKRYRLFAGNDIQIKSETQSFIVYLPVIH